MHRLKASFIFLIVSLFIFACASTKQVEKKPPFKFVGTTLSKGIDATGTTGIASEPTTTFNTQDPEVFALLNFENLSGKHTLRWEWYDPAGNLYYSTGDFPLEISRGKYLTEATAWHRLCIQGDPAAGYPGDWEVRIFLDDELKQRKLFVLKALPDPTKLPDGLLQKPYPKDWGLIIGIEDYAHLPTVEYARKDALIVRDYFIKIFGVPEENIIFLIDSDATKARMEGYLKQYIPSNVGKDTTLYVYFAGHGAPDMKKGDPYLVPHDGDTRFIQQTGYKLTSFYQDLDNLDIQRVYVFLDSCFSGVAARAAEMLIKGARPALVHVKEVRPRSDTVVSLSASSAGQMSNIYPETKHGLFTYFLLRALKGEADADDDSWISVKEIFEYVKSHVIRVSRRMGREQTPVIMPSLDILKDISVSRVLMR
jgi:hypothetical protein